MNPLPLAYAVVLLLAGAGEIAARQDPIGRGPTEGDLSGSSSGVLPGPPPPLPPAVVNRAGESGVAVRAVQVTESVDIDGALDDAFYSETRAITKVIQSIPDAGAEPSERTEGLAGFR